MIPKKLCSKEHPIKPIDNLKTVKTSLCKIINDVTIIPDIIDVCFRVHQLVIHVNQFIKLWILTKYHNNENLPIITKHLIELIFKVFTPRIPKTKTETKTEIKTKSPLLTELETFNDDVYSKISNNFKIDGTHLNQVFNYVSVNILTDIENNIKRNFDRYVKRFINSSFESINNKKLEMMTEKYKFKNINEDLRKHYRDNLLYLITPLVYYIPDGLTLTQTEKLNIDEEWRYHYSRYMQPIINKVGLKIMDIHITKKKSKYKCNKDFGYEETKKKLKRDLCILKDDLLNGTTNSDLTYHWWLDMYRSKIITHNQKCQNVRWQSDIEDDPQKYLKGMIFMNDILIKNGRKGFNILPLRKSAIINYCPFDTKILVELFVKNKQQYLSNITGYKNEIWERYFKLDKKAFRIKNYEFDYRILTDGHAVSIQLIHNKYKIKNDKKKENLKKGRKLAKEKIKMTPNEVEKINKQQTDKKIEQQKRYAEKKENFKKKTKEEKDKITEKYVEFPYIEEMTDDEIVEVKKYYEKGNNKNILFIDAGKRVLLYIIDKDGKIFKYTFKQRIKETKSLEYRKYLTKIRETMGIIEIEKELTQYNSKTCNIDEFKKYITEKTKINNKLFGLYSDKKFRQYRWYSYINAQRSEGNLIRKLKEEFGEDLIIMIGDWSIGQQMRNFVSTPNMKLKRKLKEAFPVYNVDEYKTSCITNKTKEPNKNLYLIGKDGNYHKMHPILTYKMCNNGRIGNINRDRNAVMNIREIVERWLEKQERPEIFNRGTPKATNPKKLNFLVSNGSKPLKAVNYKSEQSYKVEN